MEASDRQEQRKDAKRGNRSPVSDPDFAQPGRGMPKDNCRRAAGQQAIPAASGKNAGEIAPFSPSQLPGGEIRRTGADTCRAYGKGQGGNGENQL